MPITATASAADAGCLAANDNHKPDGRHEWPAADRLRAGRLMRTPAANQRALAALVRLRGDLDAINGRAAWCAQGDSAAVHADVKGSFQPERIVERVTAENLIALHIAGALEFREVDGSREVCEKDGARLFQIDDRLRGEKGPSRPEHPHEVEIELNARYNGAEWPSAKGAPKSARQVFLGAQIRVGAEPPVAHSPEDEMVETYSARRTVAFVRGSMPTALWEALEDTADGSTSQAIGELRGHAGKYASTVGTEVQRLALEALIEAYADFDAT